MRKFLTVGMLVGLAVVVFAISLGIGLQILFDEVTIERIHEISATLDSVSSGVWSNSQICPVHEGAVICSSLPIPNSEGYVAPRNSIVCGKNEIYQTQQLFACPMSQFGIVGTATSCEVWTFLDSDNLLWLRLDCDDGAYREPLILGSILPADPSTIDPLRFRYWSSAAIPESEEDKYSPEYIGSGTICANVNGQLICPPVIVSADESLGSDCFWGTNSQLICNLPSDWSSAHQWCDTWYIYGQQYIQMLVSCGAGFTTNFQLYGRQQDLPQS